MTTHQSLSVPLPTTQHAPHTIVNGDEPLYTRMLWPEAKTWEPVIQLPRRFGMKTERAYTFDAMNRARRKALHIGDFQIERDRYIIFSDTHKGDRTRGSDEFQINDDLYCTALHHYLNENYRLVLNGDVEEGWKAPFQTIIDAYRNTAFAWERAFAMKGPGYYLRTWGNHDIDWRDPALVARTLSPALGVPVQVHPAILLGDRIMITHGHQGDFNSDRLAWLSRRVVRRLWKPLQRVFNFSPRRTAQVHELVHRRDKHLSAWARACRMLVIAGHTHKPVMSALIERGANNGASENGRYYLNDGCCVHDRSITGIEIDRGELRLVKWAMSKTTSPARRTVFQRADLGATLAQI